MDDHGCRGCLFDILDAIFHLPEKEETGKAGCARVAGFFIFLTGLLTSAIVEIIELYSTAATTPPAMTIVFWVGAGFAALGVIIAFVGWLAE